MDDFLVHLTGIAGLLAKVIGMAEEIVQLREENRVLLERLSKYETPAQTKKWFK